MNVKMVARLIGRRSDKGGESSFDSAIRAGLSIEAVKNVMRALEISSARLAESLMTSERTLARLRAQPGKRLSPGVSDRLYRLASVYVRAVEVLESPDAAREWLKSPQLALNNRVPLDMVETEPGTWLVLDLLGRIEHGVIS